MTGFQSAYLNYLNYTISYFTEKKMDDTIKEWHKLWQPSL